MKSKAVRTYQRLLSYVRPYRGRIAVSILASMGVAGADAILAKLVQPFIDRLVIAGDRDLAQWVPVMVIGVAALKGSSMYVQRYFIQTSGQLTLRDLRNALYRHLVNLSMRFYSRTPVGVLMSRVLNDVNVMQSVVSDVLVSAMRDSVTLVALIGVALYTDWKMTVISLVVLPATGAPVVLIGRKIKNYSRRGQQAMGILTSALEQTFSGIKVIKSFGGERKAEEHFQDTNQNYYKFLRKIFKYDSGSSPIIEILAAFGIAGVLWFGLERALSGAMTQGELFSILAAILLMYAPLKRLTRVNNQIQQALAAAERVFDILDEPNEVEDQPGAVAVGRLKGEIRFDQIGIDGRDLRQMTQESLRKNIALVDQETFLFNDTVRNNILYGREEATEEALVAAARQAYADDFIRQLPEGYETDIGNRGLNISGGQRQRICIARAILKDAPILLLDEATSALDTESEAKVQLALANLMRGRTTLVIAHRLSTIMHADLIVVLDRGRIVEQGTHQQLLAAGGLYRKLYEMQFEQGR
ncbi:MAG: ABC transporter transmembrane domain-containing protein [Desulfuromonadales bacterium]